MQNKNFLFLSALLLMLSTPMLLQAAPSNKSVQVQFRQTEAYLQVTMQVSAPLNTPTLRYHGNRGWVYVEIPAGLVGKARLHRIRQDGILWVQWGWYQARPPITRVWVATSMKRPAQITRLPDGRTLVLTVWKAGYSPDTHPVLDNGFYTPIPPRNIAARMETAKPVSTADEVTVQPEVEPVTVAPEPQPQEASPAEDEADEPESAVRSVEPQVVPSSAEGTRIAQLPQLQPSLPPASKPEPAETRVAAAPPRTASRVTVDFVGAEIADVLKALSLQTQTNIVTSPEVKGTVTVSLAGVGVEEALDLITRLSGYRYSKLGNTYVVATPQGLQNLIGNAQGSSAEPRTTHIVAYRHADPTSLGKVLQEQAPGVQVSWNLTSAQQGKTPGVRMALISGTEAEVRAAAELIERVDATVVRTNQDVTIDIYTVKHVSPTDLRSIVTNLIPEVEVILGPRPGFNMLAPTPLGDSAGRTVGEKGLDNALQSGGASGAGGQSQAAGAQGGGQSDASYDERVNTLILMGPRAAVERAKETMARVDIPSPQVLIEAKVLEVSTDVDNTLGVLWDFSSTRANFSLSTPNPPDRGNLGTIVFGRLSRDAIGFSAKLDALFKDNKARLLANPKLLVLNAKQAQIFIGDEVRYIESVQSTQNGVTVTTGKVNVGIQLNVVAKTNADGDITLQIHPEVSLVTGVLKTPVGGEIPQVSRRFADSTIRLRSGETLVIGGLISQRDLKLVQKVPLLGDLPVLGHLFKQTNTKRSSSEIMVFLTASLWKD